jgi:CheY-like chemotaxis protein
MFNEFVLVAEDDESQAFFYRRSFAQIDLNDYFIVRDGEEAIDYLEGCNKFQDRREFPFPDWLLLDLKMPRKTGLEVLEWVRGHPTCRVVPTVMLSASSQDIDVSRAYDLGINAFFEKPHTLQELTHVLRLIKDFWETAQRPRLDRNHKCSR